MFVEPGTLNVLCLWMSVLSREDGWAMAHDLNVANVMEDPERSKPTRHRFKDKPPPISRWRRGDRHGSTSEFTITFERRERKASW